MKWILCGKNDVAVAILEFLVARGDEVWAVATAADDGRDGWQRSFAAAAACHGVRVDRPPRINHPEFVERLGGYGATALFSVQYDQILRPGLLRGIGCPGLNLHFALLPRHRGVAPIAWAILEGDGETGVTLHHMVPAVDAGDVLGQRAVRIGPGDTARDLYDKVSRAAVALFRDLYPFGADLLNRRLPQDGSQACYHAAGDLDFSKRAIRWNRPGSEIHRWVRAMIFPPFQYPETSVKGRRLVVRRIAGSLGPPVRARPGVIVARGEAGVEVATGDRALRITELADARDPQADPAGILGSLAAGDRFA